MKQFLAALLAAALIFSLAACGSSQTNENSSPESSPAPVPETAASSETDITPVASTELVGPASTEGETVLIAYFSRWGNTDYPAGVDATTSASIVMNDGQGYGTNEYVANMLQELVGGDIHPIRTQQPYPIDFDEVIIQNHDEIDAGYLPPLKSSDLNMAQYDTVFLVYPVWASTAPQVVFSFLEEYDLSGKTVIPLCTHAGYGSGRSFPAIAERCSQSTVLEGLAIEDANVSTAQASVSSWLNAVGMTGSIANTAESGEAPITITIGDIVLEGIWYDTELAEEIKAALPLTVSMGGYGGREFYGGIDWRPANAGEGKLRFEDGDITYCGYNNTMAIFYAQTDRPDLTMEVIPVGKVTSDLSVFDTLPGSVDITFALAA